MAAMKKRADEQRFDLAVITDLKAGSKILASNRVIHTRTQAIFAKDMEKDEIQKYLGGLGGIEAGVKIYRADALAFIKRKWDEKMLVEIIEQQQRLNSFNIEETSMICLIPPEFRQPQLLANHYITAGYLVAEGRLAKDKIESWMTVAVEEMLSPYELRNSIIAGKVVKHAQAAPATTNRTAFLPIHSIGTTFTRWRKQMEERGCPPDKLSLDLQQEILEELKPILEFGDWLKKNLQESRPVPG